jgi:small subunit ribosomal protein S5
MDDEIKKVESEFKEKIIKIERVAKVVKGGRRFSFNALAVVGDEISRVGIGFGKANEVPDAIRKAVEDAKKEIIKIHNIKGTIPYSVVGKFKAARVMLKACSPGTGIIAGDAVRAVVEKSGITDVLTKSLGSANSLNIVKATFDALKNLENASSVAKRRGLKVRRVLNLTEDAQKKEN